jgi:GPI ethanolamine phosphate transferase 1
MAISDFLTLHFFWVVRDEGSWLEIGSTISHFCIASMLCLFVAILEGVSEMFIAGVEVETEDADNNDAAGQAEKQTGADVDVAPVVRKTGAGTNGKNGRPKEASMRRKR